MGTRFLAGIVWLESRPHVEQRCPELGPCDNARRGWIVGTHNADSGGVLMARKNGTRPFIIREKCFDHTCSMRC